MEIKVISQAILSISFKFLTHLVTNPRRLKLWVNSNSSFFLCLLQLCSSWILPLLAALGPCFLTSSPTTFLVGKKKTFNIAEAKRSLAHSCSLSGLWIRKLSNLRQNVIILKNVWFGIFPLWQGKTEQWNTTFGCRYHVSWTWWHSFGRKENIIERQPREKSYVNKSFWARGWLHQVLCDYVYERNGEVIWEKQKRRKFG